MFSRNTGRDEKMRSKRQYATVDDTDRLDMGHGHTAAGHIRRFATMTRATSNRDFGFACHFRKFCYTGWWLVENLAILMDGTTSCATYYLRILSSFHKIRVKILPFFFFFYFYPLLSTWIDDSFHCSQFFKEFLWKCAGNGMIYSSQGGFNWEEFRFWLV